MALQEFSERLTLLAVRPWVTDAFILSCVVCFVAFLAVNRTWVITLPDLNSWGANYGLLTANGQWWRLFSCIFLHAGLVHLILNMWVLWNVGRLTERIFGTARYAIVVFGSGLVASMSSLVWNPLQLSVGASGAIFGVIGAFIAYALRSDTHLPRSVIRTYWLSTTLFSVFSLLNGFIGIGADNAAHVGGLLTGALLGLIMAHPLPLRPGERFDADEDSPQSTAQGAGLQPLAGAVIVVCLLGLGYAYVENLGTDLPAPAKFLKSHEWFIHGEAENLTAWSRIGGAADQGLASPAETARRSRDELLPFWKQSEARLRAELPRLPADQQAFAQDTLGYIQERIALINALVDGIDKYGAIPVADVRFHIDALAEPLARLTRLRMDADASALPRALSQSSLVTNIRGLFGSKPTCIEPPAWTGRQSGASDSASDGPAQRHAIRCLAQRAFLTHQFVTIENLLRTYPVGDLDPISGESRHDSALVGLDDLFDYGNLSPSLALANLADWRRALPRSQTPKLVEAQWFLDWAWQARSSAAAKDVSNQRWQLFKARLVMAKAALEEAARAADDEPAWYDTRLRIALGQDDTAEAKSAIAGQALEKFPYYQPLYISILHTMMPRWGGSFDAVDDFIRHQAQKWGDQEPAMYARTYTAYAYLEGEQDAFFDHGELEWADLSSGYESLLEHFPRSDELLNEYGYLACRFRRHHLFARLQPKIQARLFSGAWRDPYTWTHCQDLMH